MTDDLPQAATDPTDRERIALLTAQREHLLRYALRALHDDWPTLLTAPASTGRATGKPGSRTPVAIHRLHLAESVPRLLAEWCSLVIDQRALRPPHLATDVPTIAQWLDVHADWLAEHEVAEEVVAELRQAAGQVHAVVAPSGTKTIEVCPCPIPHCEGTVIAVLRPDDDDHYATCDLRAGHTWHQNRWEDLAALVGDGEAPLPASMSSRALAVWMSTHYRTSITDSTIRTWAHRHHDFPRPHHRTGLWPRMAVALWYLDHRAATHRAA